MGNGRVAGFAVGDILEDIFLGDPAFVAGAGDGFQLTERNAFVGGDVEDEGGIEAGSAGGYGSMPWCCGGYGRLLRLSGGGCLLGGSCGLNRGAVGGGGGCSCGGTCGCSVGADAGDDGADGYDVVDVEQYFFYDAFRDGGDFGVYLVGCDLQDGLVLFNGIAGLFVPLEDGGFHNTFTHFWHYQIDKRHSVRRF